MSQGNFTTLNGSKRWQCLPPSVSPSPPPLPVSVPKGHTSSQSQVCFGSKKISNSLTHIHSLEPHLKWMHQRYLKKKGGEKKNLPKPTSTGRNKHKTSGCNNEADCSSRTRRGGHACLPPMKTLRSVMVYKAPR